MMKIKEVPCKTALTESRLPGLQYTLNPYLGCMHQCRYCYAPGILHMKRDEWEQQIGIKRTMPLVLSKELKQKKPGIIGLSTVTDPYQPLEKTYHLTRYCLEQIKKHTFPLCIQTKSDLILRDKDLIQDCVDVEVMVSIGTLNEDHRDLFEPGSSSIKDRLKILNVFSKTEVKTSVFFGPIYPNITPRDIPGILDVFIDQKIDEIMIDRFHLKKEIIPLLSQTIKQNKNEITMHQLLSQKQRFNDIRKRIFKYLSDTNIAVKDAFK